METFSMNTTILTKLNDYVNKTGSGFECYYDYKYNKFVVINLETDKTINGGRYVLKNLIMLPYTCQANKRAKELFYDNLSNSNKKLVDRFAEDKGFFNYLRETGLYYTYLKYEAIAIDEMLWHWVQYNDINTKALAKAQ